MSQQHTRASAARSALRARVGSLVAAGRWPEALDLANAAQDSPEDTADALEIRGEVLIAWSRAWEARRDFLTAAEHCCDSVSLLCRVARIHLDDARPADAERCVDRLRALAPGNIGVTMLLAGVRELEGRLPEAAALYRKISDHSEVGLEASLAWIRCESTQGNREAGAAAARVAVERYPRSAAAWELLGVELAALDRQDEAFHALERAEVERARDTNGEDVDAYANLGIGLCGVGRVRDGVRALIHGLPERPNANGFVQLAAELLRQGRIADGFRFYEHRWFVDALAPLRARYEVPAWRGQAVYGRTILIRAEQGIGDVFQFARYLRELKWRGAKVLFQPHESMIGLAHRFDGVDEVVAPGRSLHDVDYYANLMSLPIGFETELASIPAATPTYFKPDPERVERWRNRLRRDDNDRRPIIGLVWAGRPAHARDRFRSMTIAQLAPLLEVARVRFVGLQKGPAVGQTDIVPERIDIANVGPELDDLDDAAAVIANLDLLIGVDTGLVHIAGAMGKPAWVLVAEPSDFRWLDHREDSPWYPSLRLFRQRLVGDWTSVVQRVADVLVERVSSESAQGIPSVVITSDSSVAHGDSGTVLGVVLPPHLANAAQLRAGFASFDPDEPWIGRSLDFYGEWLQARLDVALRWTPSGATIVEVVVGSGAHTVPLAAHVGSAGHLIEYETRPAMRRLFRQNLASQAIRHATLMTRSPGGPADGSFTSDRESVDDLRLDRLDGLKVNEGADAAAIVEGAVDTLWRCRPWLMFAQDDDASLAKLASRVREFGYRTWRMETPLFNPGNFNHRAEDIFDGKTALTLMALPEEGGQCTIPDDSNLLT